MRCFVRLWRCRLVGRRDRAMADLYYFSRRVDEVDKLLGGDTEPTEKSQDHDGTTEKENTQHGSSSSKSDAGNPSSSSAKFGSVAKGLNYERSIAQTSGGEPFNGKHIV